MSSQTKRQSTLKLVQIALFAAIVIVIQLFFASVKIGPVTIAFTLVPIVLAGIFIGPATGLIVGAVSGIVTFIQVFTSADPFYIFLMANNPLATALICLAKTSLAGWLSGLTFKAMRKFSSAITANTVIPAIICPTVNTGIFCLGMLVFFTGAFRADAAYSAASENLIYFVFIGLAGINFIIEFVINAVFSPAILRIIKAVKKTEA